MSLPSPDDAPQQELPDLSREAQAELLSQLQKYKAGFGAMEKAFVVLIHSADRMREGVTPLLTQLKPRTDKNGKPAKLNVGKILMQPKIMGKIMEVIPPLLTEELTGKIIPIVSQYLKYYPRTNDDTEPT